MNLCCIPFRPGSCDWYVWDSSSVSFQLFVFSSLYHIAFYICGYSLAYTKPRNADATTSFIGTEEFFLNGQVDPAFWFFKYAFSATSVTIVAGALAERSKMLAYVCYSLFVTGLVYPVLARALWSPFGFLSVSSPTPFNKVGAIDFSGAGVVHATGGMIALVAASVLGPRRGRFYDYHGKLLREPKEFPGHSIALQCLGTFILWFGCKFQIPFSLFFKLQSYIYFFLFLSLRVWVQSGFGTPTGKDTSRLRQAIRSSH